MHAHKYETHKQTKNARFYTYIYTMFANYNTLTFRVKRKKSKAQEMKRSVDKWNKKHAFNMNPSNKKIIHESICYRKKWTYKNMWIHRIIRLDKIWYDMIWYDMSRLLVVTHKHIIHTEHIAINEFCMNYDKRVLKILQILFIKHFYCGFISIQIFVWCEIQSNGLKRHLIRR